MDWLQKSLWYGFANLDNRISKNVQNIRQSYKLHHESHGKMECGINSRMTNSRCGKNPKWHLPRRLTLTITLSYNNEVTPSYTQEMHAEELVNHFMQMNDIKTFLQKLRSHHHHHHVALVARISLTLSRNSSLSFIALGRSSGQHPVSSHSCWMYVRAGHVWRSIRVHLLWARPCFSSSVLHVWFV